MHGVFRCVRACGAAKVVARLMFGILAVTVLNLVRMVV
jgi:hypothetical protein